MGHSFVIKGHICQTTNLTAVLETFDILKNIKIHVIILLSILNKSEGLNMNAIVSVVGKNTVGILATVSSECAKYNANIVDVSQTIINEYFTMFMIVNIEKLSVSFIEFVDILTELGKEKNLEIHAMHEDIFNLMHKIQVIICLTIKKFQKQLK